MTERENTDRDALIAELVGINDCYAKAVAECPADKGWLGDKPCPTCGASSAGPCWVKVAAANTFIDDVRAALKASHIQKGGA